MLNTFLSILSIMIQIALVIIFNALFVITSLFYLLDLVTFTKDPIALLLIGSLGSIIFELSLQFSLKEKQK